MRFLVGVILFATAALVNAAEAKSVKGEEPISYNYHERFGIPAAEARKKLEEEVMASGDYSRLDNSPSAQMAEYPYQAALLTNLKSGLRSTCSGVIISNSRVLTAAHCWNDGNNNGLSITAVLGSRFIYAGGARITSYIIDTHEDYDYTTATNDLAIIYIGWVLNTIYIRPIALPEPSDDLEVGETGLASGYTRTDTNLPVLNVYLRASWFPRIADSQCQALYPNFNTAADMCMGPMTTCPGDWGGPLAIEKNGVRTLVGLASFGTMAGCNQSRPTSYIRVSHYLDWIRRRL